MVELDCEDRVSVARFDRGIYDNFRSWRGGEVMDEDLLALPPIYPHVASGPTSSVL